MRIYATREDNGKKFLAALQCDGCAAEIKPHPEIAKSGWRKEFHRTSHGPTLTYDWCPECAQGRVE